MRKSRFLQGILLFSLGLVLFAGCRLRGEGIWQFYRMNAQYRGAVKKSFQDIGCSLAWFNDIAPGQSQVIAHVCVENPEKRQEIFAFRTNLIISCTADSLTPVQEVYAEFEGVNGERRNEVKQLVCLWDYIRRNLFQAAKINGIINVAGRPVSLKARSLRNRIEVNCSSADRRKFSGKFFLSQTANGNFCIDKFRFRSGKVAISMVQDTAEAVSKDFRFRQPFSRLVFDNK